MPKPPEALSHGGGGGGGGGEGQQAAAVATVLVICVDNRRSRPRGDTSYIDRCPQWLRRGAEPRHRERPVISSASHIHIAGTGRHVCFGPDDLLA